jgi:hypothetical protein
MDGWITLAIWLMLTLALGVGLIVQPGWMINQMSSSAMDFQKRKYLRKAGFVILVIGVGFGIIKAMHLSQILH